MILRAEQQQQLLFYCTHMCIDTHREVSLIVSVCHTQHNVFLV